MIKLIKSGHQIDTRHMFLHKNVQIPEFGFLSEPTRDKNISSPGAKSSLDVKILSLRMCRGKLCPFFLLNRHSEQSVSWIPYLTVFYLTECSKVKLNPVPGGGRHLLFCCARSICSEITFYTQTHCILSVRMTTAEPWTSERYHDLAWNLECCTSVFKEVY